MDRAGERNEETHQGAQASLYHTLIEGGERERIDEAIKFSCPAILRGNKYRLVS